MACQARVAHLTRLGKSRTPVSTASLPMSAGISLLPVTMSWNRPNRASASSRRLPLRAVVIRDAEAVEIAQP